MPLLGILGPLLASILAILGLGSPAPTPPIPPTPPGVVDISGTTAIALTDEFLAELESRDIQLSGNLTCDVTGQVELTLTDGMVTLGCSLMLRDDEGNEVSIGDLGADLASQSVTAVINRAEKVLPCFTFRPVDPAAIPGRRQLNPPDQEVFLTKECLAEYHEAFDVSDRRMWDIDDPIATTDSEWIS